MTAKIYRRLLIGLSFIICHLSFSVALTSCSNDYDPTYLEEVRVSQSYIGFAAEGSTATIKVNATADWTITDIPEWVTVSPTSGSAGTTEVTFTTVQATATQEATVILECGGAKQRINLIQMTKKAEAQLATCAQVTAGTEGATYRVRGVCATNPDNQYGNWNIQDETGQVYIYGTLDKKGGKGTYPISGTNGWGFGIGDIVTVEGPMKNYNGTIELVDVTVVSIEKSLIKVESLSTTDPLPATGGEVTAFISCKGNGVGVILADDAKSWLSISGLTPGSVTFTAAPNEGDFRKTNVTFTTVDDQGNEYTAQAAISQKAKPNAAGSEANPFTVAEIISFTKSLGSNGKSDVNVYVKGKISSIKYTYSAQFGTATYNISDNGEENDVFTVYGSYYYDGQPWTEGQEQIEVGDEVIVCGKVIYYNGTTPEFANKENWLVSLKKGGSTSGTDPGTQANPFNITQAISYIDAGGADDVYVTGIVSKIVYTFNAEYGTGTFWISDDGKFNDDPSKDFEAYSVYWFDGKPWTDGCGQVAEGDKVVLCGKLTKYKTTYETSSKKAYVYSINGKTE